MHFVIVVAGDKTEKHFDNEDTFDVYIDLVIQAYLFSRKEMTI